LHSSKIEGEREKREREERGERKERGREERERARIEGIGQISLRKLIFPAFLQKIAHQVR
jgi:hypothetical protein